MKRLIIHGKAIPCRVIVFDKDGTLVDLRHVLLALVRTRMKALEEIGGPEAVAEYVRGCGYRLEDGFIDPRGPLAVAARREEEVLAAGALYLHGFAWSEARRLAGQAFTRAEELIEATDQVELLPYARETVQRLKEAGFLVVLATGDGHARAERMMAQAGILPYLDLIVGVDEVAQPKPSPDLVLAVAERLGIPPALMVGIGDACLDAQMGRAAGMQAVIGVASGGQSGEELAACADMVIATLAELEVG
jgi:phosphoglycolate phosphatase